MTEINYMERLPGGHCFTCHKDFTEWFEEHPCLRGTRSDSTPCGEQCKDTKYPYPL